MQSFFTIFFAGLAAFAAMFMLNPDPAPQTASFVSVEMPDLVLPDAGLPSFLVDVHQPLVLALETSVAYSGTIDMAVDAFGASQD
ncbi:MAG: hypothetical protein ABJH52_03415 [Henriciella sp.]